MNQTVFSVCACAFRLVAARIFNQKLNLLFKINSEEDSIGCHIFSKLAAKDPQSLRIIQECRYLEDRVECHGATDNILNSETSRKLRTASSRLTGKTV